MSPDEDTTVAEAEALDADFGAGFTGEEAKKPAKVEKPARETPREEPKKPVEAEAPEYVQVARKDWEEVRAAAQKTASYDQQLSKAFGAIGNLKNYVNDMLAKGGTPQATPTPPQGKKIEISKEAFAEMRKDFPELADQTRAALEAALNGVSIGDHPKIEATEIEQMLATLTSKREIENLEDAYPDWRKIVGAVDISKEQPDPENPFRKWLATKDAAYQARVNGAESAAVIGRAIRTFQTETKAQAKPATPPRDERADRIRNAVQPRGDGAGAAPAKTDDDEFVAGFNSR